MSTISLPPLKNRITITKSLEGKYDRLLGDKKKFHDLGLIKGYDEIILDPGTDIRIEGYSSVISGGNWPLVKISIYPDKGKKCELYISLELLDGLTWKMVKEERSIPKPPRQVFITPNYWSWKEDKKIKPITHVWGGMLPDSHPITKKDEVILNPHNLKAEEISSGKFELIKPEDLFEVLIKKEGKNFTGKVSSNLVCKFDIVKEPGLMKGILKEVYYKGTMNIGPSEEWSKIYTPEEFHLITQDDLKKEIRGTIRKKYEV